MRLVEFALVFSKGLHHRAGGAEAFFDADKMDVVAPEFAGAGSGEVASLQILAFVTAGGFELLTVQLDAEGFGGVQIYIPTEDEWYKAAYYNGSNSTYSRYPNGQDSMSTAEANYGNSVGSSTNVGFYEDDPSFYGTFDQGGNVWEWNDAVIDSSRGYRGSSFTNLGSYMASSSRYSGAPTLEVYNFGFRVASVTVAAVPEPSGLVLTMLIGAGFICHRRKSL